MLIKRATKLYFMLYSCMVIILFNMDLYKSVFSIYSFKKQAFQASCLSVFRVLKTNVVDQKIKVVKKI